MEVALLVLAVIGGAVVVGGTALLVMRLQSSQGSPEREGYLQALAASHGGELSKTGLMGHETITFTHGQVKGKIVFAQNVSQHQTRYLTHVVFNVPDLFVDLHLQTRGNSPPSSFSPTLPPKLQNLPDGLPHNLDFFSHSPEPAANLIASLKFKSFINTLAPMAGLAKFELLQVGHEFKFAIDGFILEDDTLMALYNLLLDQARS